MSVKWRQKDTNIQKKAKTPYVSLEGFFIIIIIIYLIYIWKKVSFKFLETILFFRLQNPYTLFAG